MNPMVLIAAVLIGMGGAAYAYKLGEAHERDKQQSAMAETNVSIAKLNGELAAERAKKAEVIKQTVTEIHEVKVEVPVPGKTIVLRPECDMPADLRAKLNRIK